MHIEECIMPDLHGSCLQVCADTLIGSHLVGDS